MSKKKLLIITPYIPYPLDSGGKISQFEINDSIRKHLDITIVFPVKKENMQALSKLREIWPDVLFEPYFPSLLQTIRLIVLKILNYGLLSRMVVFADHILRRKSKFPNDSSMLRGTHIYRKEIVDPGIITHTLSLITKETYDAIQVEFHAFLPIIQFLPKHLTSIFIHHEIRFARENTELNTLEGPHDLLKRLHKRNKILEISYLKEYSLVVTLSDDDKRKLTPYLKHDQVIVSPFVIRAGVLSGQEFAFGNKLIFIGGQDHLPNQDGLQWFITNCWGQLKKSIPELEIDIIGRWNAKTVDWYLPNSGINFLGFVDDIYEASKNSISVVPIRIGSGIRMKIIETVNTGIPFITTTIGVEGLNFQNGIDCIIADDPDCFVAGIKKIILEKTLGGKLAEHARATLKKEYSYDKIINQRLSAYA